MTAEPRAIKLPAPSPGSGHAIEQLLAYRRSRREFAGGALELAEIARLLWAAQGITDPRGLRTAPSAGALYPLGVYLASGRVNGLEPGVYRYLAEKHALVQTTTGDHRVRLAEAALDQEAVTRAAAVLAITGIHRRMTHKYGERGIRYVHMEVGHAAQNVYLVAESLGIGTVMVGAFDDAGVSRALNLAADEVPLALLPLGRRG